MQKAFEESFPAFEEKAEVKEEDKDEAKPAENEADQIDDEKTGGEWVTVENLYKHISKGDSEALI